MSSPKYIRIQQTVGSALERRLLNALCLRLPAWVMPDHLTLLGVLGGIVVFISYTLSSVSPHYLWLASFGYVVHWFGDSLDGSLARFRQTERPTYGYFLDHNVDAGVNLMIAIGLGFSPYVRMDVSILMISTYFLLCMFVFLKNFVVNDFQLTFMFMGPTELRLCLIIINAVMYFSEPREIEINGQFFSYFDLLFIAVSMLFTVLFIYNVLKVSGDLKRQDDAKRRNVAASEAAGDA
jgi:archaetidylinositol phosphate synthase